MNGAKSTELAELTVDLNAIAPDELWAQLRPHLLHINAGYPYEAIGVALLAQESLASLWVEELEAIAQDHTLIDDEFIIHFHLTVLLAARHDTRAFAPLLALCRLSEAESDDIWDDFATSVMGRALAAVSGGEVRPLLDLVDAPDVSIWLRGAALTALTIRAQEGDADRFETSRMLLEWGHSEAARLRDGQTDIYLLNLAITGLCDLCYVEAEPAIRQWHDDGLFDKNWHGAFSKVQAQLRYDFAEVSRQARKHGQLYISDVVSELDTWAMFTEKEDKTDLGGDVHPAPFTRQEPKVGRNDPCPCGSGKKFKKCCGGS